MLEFGQQRIEVIETPGHTRGHIVYLLRDEKVAFVGDTLFAMECGRLFEGTPEQRWSSLQKLLGWPDETRIYCAHEYTASMVGLRSAWSRTIPTCSASART